MALSTPVVQIIDRDPVAVDIAQPVSEAIRLLSGDRIHHLPVVDGRELVGLLSATDIIEFNSSVAGTGKIDYGTAAKLDEHYRIENVMRRDIITVSHRATIGDAARKLSAGGFHALPVIDDQGDLIGIVTTTDLIGHMLETSQEALPAEAQQRLRALEQVFDAAQHYLNSGQGAREHAELERTIDVVRTSSF